LETPPTVESYFPFGDAKDAGFIPDEVVLFSGGLDSLAGTIEELLPHGKKVALVSHRSASKIVGAQNYLIRQLRRRFGRGRILHVPVWAHLEGSLGKETTHRTRSFLFATLGAVTAQLLERKRICFFENGVVSLNLPPVGQVVGARATRTTHPQALAGFRRVLSAVLEELFDVSNPYAWMTKSEVIERIVQNGCGDLIPHTRSCTRVHSMNRLHPHCGKCSQCIDRRFAILAASQQEEDPVDAYEVDLLLGEREAGPDREMALAYVRSASKIKRMTDIEFLANYGETSRIVGFFGEPANTVTQRIFHLHRRHADAVCNVFDNAIATNAAEIREGSLPASCLLSLIVARGGEALNYVPLSAAPASPNLPAPEIRLSIDAGSKRVSFARWGDLKGADAKLIIALAAPFRKASQDELAPERYPFIEISSLMDQLKVGSQGLRNRVLRCRNAIKKLAKDAGDPVPSTGAVIENSPWHGYRLNPDNVRLVALSSKADA
jgi:hypothetical protein